MIILMTACIGAIGIAGGVVNSSELLLPDELLLTHAINRYRSTSRWMKISFS